MKSLSLLQKLQQSDGYIANTHVEMTGLDHSDTYLNKDLLLTDPGSLKTIAEYVNDLLLDDIEVVCGPPLGGLLLAEAVVLNAFEQDKRLKLVSTEKSSGKIKLKRGQAKLIKDKNILVIDDVVKTGQTLAGITESITRAGGKITQIVVLVNWYGLNLKKKLVKELM